jgi:hypothetical protein
VQLLFDWITDEARYGWWLELNAFSIDLLFQLTFVLYTRKQREAFRCWKEVYYEQSKRMQRKWFPIWHTPQKHSVQCTTFGFAGKVQLFIITTGSSFFSSSLRGLSGASLFFHKRKRHDLLHKQQVLSHATWFPVRGSAAAPLIFSRFWTVLP